MHAVCCARPKELQADVESAARPLLLPHLLPPPRCPSGRPPVVVVLSLCCQAPQWDPFLLLLGACFSYVCHILWRYSFSLHCVTCFTWVLQFDFSFFYVEMCARWKGGLQGTASSLICIPREPVVVGCAKHADIYYCLLFPFHISVIIVCFSLYLPPSLVLCCVPFLIARAGAEKKMLVVLCNWMSCALFLMLHAFVTILFYFFLPIQWHYIVARFLSLMLETLLVCYCWAAFTKLAL